MSFLDRTGALILSVLLLAFSPAWAQPAATFASAGTLVNDDSHFVAKFPGAVQRGTQLVDTAAGKVTVNMVYHGAGAMAYMIVYSDYPPGTVTRAGGPEIVCDHGSKRAVQSVNGTIRTSAPCQLGEVRGLAVTADIPSKGQVARLRYFVLGDRSYQIIYICPAAQELSPVADTFFDSFRLTH